MGIADEVTRWVAANWDLDMTLRGWWQRMSDAGLAFPAWPEGLGGRGWRPAQAREVLVALGAAGIIGPPTGNAPNMGAPTVLAHGTDEQISRFHSRSRRERRRGASCSPSRARDLTSRVSARGRSATATSS